MSRRSQPSPSSAAGPRPGDVRRTVRRRAGILFLLVLVGHSYFSGDTSWNQNARLGAIFTFVEPGPDRGTFRIDALEHRTARVIQTSDWARGADRHLYPNKPPGASMIGVPMYALLYAIESAAGAGLTSAALTRVNARVINVWSGPLWTAVASVVMFLFFVARGVTIRAATMPPLVYAFGTLVLPFDTSLWGHTTAAACVLVAVCLAFWPPDRSGESGSDEGAPRVAFGRARAVRCLVAGFFAGFALLVDYVSVFSLAAIGLALLFRRGRWRAGAAFAAGSALPLLALLAYQKVVFGGWLTPTIVRTNPVFISAARTWGAIGPIDPDALWRLLVSPYRGLFLYCPVLIFTFVGAWRLWRDGDRLLVAACVSASLGTWLLVASFNGWWGGFCNGPRYLIAVIPLLVMLLPPLSQLPVAGRALYGAALTLSFTNMIAISAVEVMVAEADRNPLYGFTYSRFFAGQYPVSQWSTNTGLWMLGLRPPVDVALFVLFVGAGVFLLWRREPDVA